MTGSYWTCRRKILGTPCSRVNPSSVRKCRACGTRKPAKRKPKHMQALEIPYELYVQLNGGPHCGICGAVQKLGGRKLHRDHDHKTGKPRGVLCFRCNTALPSWVTAEWLELATAYLQRAEARWRRE